MSIDLLVLIVAIAFLVLVLVLVGRIQEAIVLVACVVLLLRYAGVL